MNKDMDNRERLSMLAAFINLLKDNLDFSFNINSLDDRIKLQKYVFIAKSFGLDFGYHYSLYIHGPYSPNLANDYYYLSLNGYNDNGQLPRTFKIESFKSAVQGRSIKWLEIVSTALSFMGANPKLSKNELLNLVIKIKGTVYKQNDIKEILEEATKYNLL